MAPIQRPRPSRRDVAREYGHPWPWRVCELVEEYAVEQDVDLRDLADRWGVNSGLMKDWIRRHGFRVEQHRAVR